MFPVKRRSPIHLAPVAVSQIGNRVDRSRGGLVYLAAKLERAVVEKDVKTDTHPVSVELDRIQLRLWRRAYSGSL
jgi:hypothetical protein